MISQPAISIGRLPPCKLFLLTHDATQGFSPQVRSSKKKGPEPMTRSQGPFLLRISCCAIYLEPPLSRRWPKVTLLVSRFQHLPILYHHAELSREFQRTQELFHRCGQHFRRTHLAPQLNKRLLITFHLPVPCHVLALLFTSEVIFQCAWYSSIMFCASRSSGRKPQCWCLWKAVCFAHLHLRRCSLQCTQ